MDDKYGKSFVGRVDDHINGKGWFFGAFMSANSLLQSDLVEVAWQEIPNEAPVPDQAHLHKAAVEINVIIRGWMKLKIDGKDYALEKRDFYIIWPGSVVSDIVTGPDTELICIKAPSIPGDKYPVT